MGFPAQRIGYIVSGKRTVTADTDLRPRRFFGLSDGCWLRTQAAHDIEFPRAQMADEVHHIGLGYEHNGHVVRILVHDLHVTVVHADTGEIIRDLELDPERDYQSLGRKPGPVKGLPQRGGRKKKTPPT